MLPTMSNGMAPWSKVTVCVAMIVAIVHGGGCVQCKQDEVRRGNHCYRTCNADEDCGGEERCVSGVCETGNPPENTVSSSMGTMVSSASASASSAVAASSSVGASSVESTQSSSITESSSSISHASTTSTDAPDAAAGDGGTPDAQRPDANSHDSGTAPRDGGQTDAHALDAHLPDAHVPDAHKPDGGVCGANRTECMTSSGIDCCSANESCVLGNSAHMCCARGQVVDPLNACGASQLRCCEQGVAVDRDDNGCTDSCCLGEDMKAFDCDADTINELCCHQTKQCGQPSGTWECVCPANSEECGSGPSSQCCLMGSRCVSSFPFGLLCCPPSMIVNKSNDCSITNASCCFMGTPIDADHNGCAEQCCETGQGMPLDCNAGLVYDLCCPIGSVCRAEGPGWKCSGG